jgi:hypothetical protein
MSNDPSDAGPGGASGLLGQSALTLQAHGYRTRYVVQDSGQLLLATSPWFIIGIAQFESIADLPTVESEGSFALSEQLADVGPLRWDAYLVLLTSGGRADDEMPLSVAEITYNTQYHRRLIRWDVLPTEDSLATALRPFLPLPSANVSEPTDPVRSLVNRMQLHGLSSSQAEMSVGQWIVEGRRRT